MDTITQNALDHVRRNGVRYRRDYFGPGPYPRKIEAIKQLRSETNAGLKEAKDAIEAWDAEGRPVLLMSEIEAKILLKNLLLRGGQSGLTPLEVEAIRRLAE
jgi:hypothetical protein